ncbi:MAG: mechanosensitive ion channel family protein [Oleibacter sp.]|nr:mechanosensitive ion channel family protein [Thalassolituus sp.]
MRLFIFIISCWLSVITNVVANPAMATAEVTNNETTNSDSKSVAVDRETVTTLISTLKNKEQRDKFIKQLELLVTTKEQEDTSLTALFNLDTAGSGFTQQMTVLMEKYGVSQNTLGDIITLCITIFVVILGVFINGRISFFFDRRMRPVRNRFHLDKRRFYGVFRIQRWSGYGIGLILIFYASAQAVASYMNWDADKLGLGAMMSSLLTLSLVFLVFTLIWDGVNAILESVMHRHEKLKNSRFETITPIIRNILLFTLSMMSVMVVLSEIGINIMPLLAGAGVLGIAIGFGAQTLVKDFLTGLTVIFEDLLQIGDVIKLGDHFGLVEKITLRKIQLRDLDGTVHTIPFGEVAIVSNLTKEFSFYLFDIGVAYRENTDDVIAVLREIDEELRKDEAFKDRILAPLEVFGVDQFADSAVMIKARIKTLPIQQWNVGREFNRRMKIAFDERGIEIPFPHQTIYFGEDKQGRAPNANVNLIKDVTEKDVSVKDETQVKEMKDEKAETNS